MNSSLQGIVFDIHRFSLHDGPGIRTTVFLKGCPLSCKWCHNPESRKYKPQISFSAEKCINCFDCIKLCNTGAQKIINNKHVLQFNLCNACGDCISACPSGAIKIYGELKSIDEVMSVVIRDSDYYKNSGGGLTISGGEPMTQFEFTKELLRNAKKQGIHTCIETCGFAPPERFLEILDYVDLFLYDYKESDPEKHMADTGVSNKLILNNLDLLYNNGARIILRCPLIPGINDSENHFRGIKQLQEKYPKLNRIDIMAYHNIGVHKLKQIGETDSLPQTDTSSREIKSGWLKALKSLECDNVKLG